MNRRIGKVDIVLFVKPLLNAFVTSKPLRLGETLFKLLEDGWGNRLLTGIGTGLSNFLNSLKAPLFVELQSVGHGVTVNTQMVGRCASAFSLSGFQKKQHSEAALDLGLSFLANEGFELVDRFGNLGKVVHRSTRAEKKHMAGKGTPLNVHNDPL